MSLSKFLLSIVIWDKADIGELMAREPGDKVPQLLTLVVAQVGLQPPVEQRHVVVEHLVAGETIPKPLVRLTPREKFSQLSQVKFHKMWRDKFAT